MLFCFGAWRSTVALAGHLGLAGQETLITVTDCDLATYRCYTIFWTTYALGHSRWFCLVLSATTWSRARHSEIEGQRLLRSRSKPCGMDGLFQGQFRKSMPLISTANSEHGSPHRRCVVPLAVWWQFRSFPKGGCGHLNEGLTSWGALREFRELWGQKWRSPWRWIVLAARRCGSDAPHRRAYELRVTPLFPLSLSLL